MRRLLFSALIAILTLLVETAAAKVVVVSSHCPMTGVTGIGRASTFEVAKEAAIKACIAKGGVPACCYKFVRQVSG